MALSGVQWIEQLAGHLGVAAPSEEELATLLDLAGVAAHASERTAAPISCWLAARAGITPEVALAAAHALAAELAGPTAP
jgi:hypothetical protein